MLTRNDPLCRNFDVSSWCIKYRRYEELLRSRYDDDDDDDDDDDLIVCTMMMMKMM